MKLSFTTLGCPDWSLERAIDEAARLGFAGIEVRGIENEMRAERIPCFMPGRQQDTKRLLRAKGVTLCGFGSSCRFDDEAALDANLAEGRAAIDVCAAMDIPALRVFGNDLHEGEAMEVTAARVARGIAALCDYAEGSGVTVLLEVHGQFNTVETLLPVCEAVRKENFGLIWDVAHTDLRYGDDFATFYHALKPWIRHIHMKDHRHVEGKTALCDIGKGDIPLKAIVALLQEEGYDGWYSFEWEKKWQPDLPDADVAFPLYAAFMHGL